MGDADATDAIVAAVVAGTDDIVVPAPLVQESEAPATPEARSLFAQITTMGIAEKIKLALRGNKDARMILVRDNNKVIRRLVLQNPRITDAEVLQIANNRTADEELLRIMAARREWNRNYAIRLALTKNPKTPLALAIKQITTLGERDIRALAKSRNVPQGVSVQARRILAARNPGGE